MSDNLRVLIEVASGAVEMLFDKNGTIRPMYHCITTDGAFVTPAPHEDKDFALELVRRLFVVKNVVAYVFIDEAWMVDKAGRKAEGLEAWVMQHGTKNHPDRREIVMFLAEDLTGQMSAHRFILRPEHGKPKLSPLKFIPASAQSHGRMVGLLR